MVAEGEPVELILPATRRVVPELVRQALGAREVRFATEDEMDRFFLGCETGAIPPLRHWLDVGMLLDPSLCVPGDIVFQAGTHSDAVRLPFDQWYRLVHPRLAPFSEPAAPAPA